MSTEITSASPLAAARRRDAGFSLIEAMIALALSALLIIAVLNLFDQNSQLAHSQNEISEMQQAQRIVQYEVSRSMRMTGRGGLPLTDLPDGNALSVRNNVGADEHISLTDTSTPEVYPGTDVLTIRGAFSSPIYQLQVQDNPDNLNLDDNENPTTGWVRIAATTPEGIPQDLTALSDAITNEVPEALVLVDAVNDQRYAVVELDTDLSVVGAGFVDVYFFVEGGVNADAYKALYPAGNFDGTNLRSARSVGVLEEYRYYVRKASLGDRELPQLMRARAFPGTEEPYRGDASNWATDLAENIFDLQIAFGVDLDGDGLATEGVPGGEVEPADDEWLFNHGEDDAGAAWGAGQVVEARITTLARVARRDPKYEAPSDPEDVDFLARLENHTYGEDYVLNNGEGLGYRRRLLPTVISLRNL